MVSEFDKFAMKVRARFAVLAAEPLFTVAADRDAIWQRYLAAFPPGTNPIFRERTEHDCACCRHFIRSIGNVVAIQNGALSTVWDLTGLPAQYQAVADAMADYVRGLNISNVFYAPQAHYGQDVTPERTESGLITWHHFSVSVPRRFVVGKQVAERQGDARTTYEVLKRGITELDPGAVETVVDLIRQGALYRGEENSEGIRAFQRLQERALAAFDAAGRDRLIWANVTSPAARFRNTVIGTLVQDLSEGKDLEAAVKAYEVKVAPQNYKRSSALITKRMIDDAMKTIIELDLEGALRRRHARLEDVSVSSVLFVDRSVRGRMRGGVHDLLMEEVKPAPLDETRAESIDIEDFVANILPKASSVQLHVDNAKLGNFVSLTAPADDNFSGQLFKWGNDFAWSYEGNATDSIKERVKRAGGRVEGVALRASLSWSNFDDLDLHAHEPGGYHIYYSNKHSPTGELDVDMNAGRGTTREPVENIRWTRLGREGSYQINVHQFMARERTGAGFEVEIEYDSRIETFRYDGVVRTGTTVNVAEVRVRAGKVVSVEPGLEVVAGAASREQWGIATQRLHKVNAVVLSPNHWNGRGVGARHWIFALDGCRNPEPTRGIYNEFLSPALAKHRKVFEVLGDKTKCPPVDEQLSGVGFTKGRGDSVVVAVAGSKMRKTYRVTF